MDISNIITATVSLSSPGITRIGFGEPGILFYGPNTVPSANPITDLELVRRYTTSTILTDMVADGFATTDPVYLAAQAVASQNPAPPTIKLIRGGTAFTQDVELEVLTDTTGATIAVTITKGATARTYTQTAAGGGIPAEATALALLMNNDASGWGSGGSGELTIAGVGNVVEIDTVSPANDGELWYFSAMTNIAIEDVTPDRGIATDLAAAVLLDADWYALVLADAFGAIEIQAASTWANAATNKILCASTQDSEVMAGTGIGATLSGLNHTETYLQHSQHSMSQYPAGAAAGRFLPLDPGTEMWAHKSLTGVTPSQYTQAQVTAMTADYVNMYTGVTIGGIEVVAGNLFKGWNSGSSEGFIDTTRLIDALVVEVQTRVLSVLRSSDKVPYTDAGISSIKSAVLAGIRVFQPEGFEVGSEFVNVPLKSSISAVDIAARDLPDVVFGATLAGGIATVVITGQIST
jgi:hypothetical protein